MKYFDLGMHSARLDMGLKSWPEAHSLNRSSFYVYHVYPAWDQGSGILHVIGCYGPNSGMLRKTWRCGGNKVEDSKNWEVKQDTWDGFTPASLWYPSWLRESSDILLVISCLRRNSKSHHFSQSWTTVVMYLELFLPLFAVNWVSRKRNPELNHRNRVDVYQ